MSEWFVKKKQKYSKTWSNNLVNIEIKMFTLQDLDLNPFFPLGGSGLAPK